MKAAVAIQRKLLEPAFIIWKNYKAFVQDYLPISISYQMASLKIDCHNQVQ